MIVTTRRLSAGLLGAVLASGALVTGLSAAPAVAAEPVQVGLFGAGDPTYDGVFRQSLSLLAYVAAGQTPPTASVTWLLHQQCPDGGFQAYRADPAAACQKSDPATYSGEDTNATGLAAVALTALGRGSEAAAALTWLGAAQNGTDGGFPYFVGGDSDTNSTAIALLATNAAGRTPAQVVTSGRSAAAYLAALQLGCAAATAGGDGGLAFQDLGTGLVANDAATAQAVLASSGRALPFVAGTISTDVPRLDCSATPPSAPTFDTTALGAGYLARLMDTYGGAVPQYDFTAGSRLAGTVSVGDTAWAVLSLAAAGTGRTQLDAALAVLAARTAPGAAAAATGTAAAAAATAEQPGLLAVSALAVHASGGSASTVDAYVARIGATVRTAPAATPTPTPLTTSAAPSVAPSAAATGVADPLPPTGSSTATLALGVGGAVLLALGLLAVAVTRRREDEVSPADAGDPAP